MEHISRLLRYLHDPEPRNNSVCPIVCLSHMYSNNASTDQTAHNDSRPWPQDFVLAQESLFCFTYRTGFPRIHKEASSQALGAWFSSDGFTTDVGFGCMIRSTQTLLANVISTLRLGREWKRGTLHNKERDVIRLFADDPKAPYSIHKFIAHGAQACGKPAGQWFGPNAASLCIEALTIESKESDLHVYVASEQGGTIYEDEVLQNAAGSITCPPILLLVPQRLGHDKINPRYHESLASVFDLPQFMGIAGGRPSSAHFFFAKQELNLFFLDPHGDQPRLPYYTELSEYTDDDVDRCHTSRIRRMPMTDMDPSMLIGFLIKDKSDWDDFKAKLSEGQGALKIATITDSRPSYLRSAVEPEVHDIPEDDVLLDEDGLQ